MNEIVKRFEDILSKDFINKECPVVVHSALWGLLRISNENKPLHLACDIIEVLHKFFERIFMPSFTYGYNQQNICDLDSLQSQCGLISEIFRNQYAISRTLSAFFSFSALGYSQSELATIRPKNVWGDGSLYEWFENNNVLFMTIGLNISHLSYMHRFEWLNRDKVYEKRFLKPTSGTIIRNGKKIPMEENLFARKVGVNNDFTVFDESLKKMSLVATSIYGIPIQIISVECVKKIVQNIVEENPEVIYV